MLRNYLVTKGFEWERGGAGWDEKELIKKFVHKTHL
jgi:hypothetical protein